MPDINQFAAGSGRRIKEDGSVVNTAEMIEALYNALVVNKNAGVTISGANSSGGALGVDINQSEAIVPTDQQSRLQTTIQTHNAVSVAASGTSYGDNVWHDADGFDKIGLTLMSDNAAANNGLSIYWSNDGTNIHGGETAIASGTGQYRTSIVETKARYYKLQALNNDAGAAHTMSAWAYSKV